jgi:hypothetical protein
LREALGYDITISFEYDANGNLIHIEPQAQYPDTFYDITEMEFQYDLKNRLTKYRFGGEGYWNEIKYDALGRVRERLSADETPITNKFYSDGRQLIQQLDSSNNAEFDYLRGPTGLDRQWNESSVKRYFYIKDPLGTVWAMIESGFTPQQSPIIRLYNYNAWGEHIDASDINFPDYNSDPNLMRYIGCRVEAFGKGTTTQRDAIYHLDHRHYLPSISYFMQMDPLCIFDSVFSPPFRYARNKPTIERDILGLESFQPGTGTGNCCRINDPLLYYYMGLMGEGAESEMIFTYARCNGKQRVFSEYVYTYEGSMLLCWFKGYRLSFYPYKCRWTYDCPTQATGGVFRANCPEFADNYQSVFECGPEDFFYWQNTEWGWAPITAWIEFIELLPPQFSEEQKSCWSQVKKAKAQKYGDYVGLPGRKAFVGNIPCICAKSTFLSFILFAFPFVFLEPVGMPFPRSIHAGNENCCTDVNSGQGNMFNL